MPKKIFFCGRAQSNEISKWLRRRVTVLLILVIKVNSFLVIFFVLHNLEIDMGEELSFKKYDYCF